jgi:hypothetical protein
VFPGKNGAATPQDEVYFLFCYTELVEIPAVDAVEEAQKL